MKISLCVIVRIPKNAMYEGRVSKYAIGWNAFCGHRGLGSIHTAGLICNSRFRLRTMVVAAVP